MQKEIKIDLPQSFYLNRRRFFKHSEIEHLKRVLIAKSIGAEIPKYSEPETESFVNATDAANDLGISRRTMGRLLAEQDKQLGLPRNPVAGLDAYRASKEVTP